MSKRPIRVLKLGGSLLDNHEFVQQFDDWLQLQPPAWNLVIVGGGNLVEAMRDLDRSFQLPSSFVHWACVRLLESTFEVVCQLFPHATMVSDRQQWLALATRLASAGAIADQQCTAISEVAIINVPAFYAAKFAQELPIRLPENWSTTSDSIAALLCRIVQADELVLLKSTDPPAESSIENLAQQGIVDAAFPEASHGIGRIRIVNMRSTTPSVPRHYLGTRKLR